VKWVIRSAIIITLLFGVITFLDTRNKNGKFDLVASVGAATTGYTEYGACTFPTAVSPTLEETAWRLFVAANCPTKRNKVVWEDWVEQLQLYPATGVIGGVASAANPKRLHGSPLARAVIGRLSGPRALLAPATECQQMQASNAPPNVTPTATVCEEARLNPDAAAFVTTNKYQVRPGQTAAAQKGIDIEFPRPAIEVKVDWIPATDFNPPFTCSNPPVGVHVEMIDGACYAMAGMHISSKLLKNWVWATFEPQSMLTNPLRCITFGDCNDPWGSIPAKSSGGSSGFTSQSPAIQYLMKQANLASEFSNYRLDGVQVDFTTANAAPTLLGNSIIEGENAGLKRDQASCITCHSVSSIKNDGTDAFGAVFINLVSDPSTIPKGAQYNIPTGWIARDFVWSLAFGCPDPTKSGEQPCH